MMTLDSIDTLYRAALQAHREANGQTAAAILDLCAVVRTVRHALSSTDRAVFYGTHRLTADGKPTSRLRTMLAIAKADDRLRPLTASLPASLATLGRLARLPSATLTESCHTGAIHPLMTTEDAHLLVANTRTTTDPASSKPKTGPADYSVTLHWFHAEWTPAKGRAVRKTLQRFLAANAQALGLQPDVTWSVDADVSMLTDERTTAAA